MEYCRCASGRLSILDDYLNATSFATSKQFLSLTELAEKAFFAGRETARPAKSSASLKGKGNDKFLLWRPSLPEQKINPSAFSVNSSAAGERYHVFGSALI